ncbi:MAG TPA: LytTR family DNA-binding domain-containing protein [Gemmatimonadaceae bacterium]|jgi:two-component system LytT family response regulator|nr:LytTR family DNA-binding domain-containing protein [Gemmatimonadaceae bacterium]
MTQPTAGTHPLRVVVVDDETLPRQRLIRLLEEIPNAECVGECANGRSALDAIESLLPDLVLLDVRMPGMGGLDVARALTGHVPFIIFVTAFDEYALSAFEVHAIDYLLKPVERERFVAAVERARALVSSTTAAQRHERLLALLQDERRSPDLERGGDPLPEPPAPASSGDGVAFPRRFLVKGDGQMYFVAVDDIDWVEAYGNYVRLHVGKGVHLIRETLGNIERKLDPNRFARVHRSSIVNLDRVARMDLWGAGDYIVLLKDGTKLKLSRWYRSRIEQQTR